MLTTQKAKWYCWETEKYRVRDISKQSVAEDIRNIAASERFFISATWNKLNKIQAGVNVSLGDVPQSTILFIFKFKSLIDNLKYR